MLMVQLMYHVDRSGDVKTKKKPIIINRVNKIKPWFKFHVNNFKLLKKLIGPKLYS